MKYGKRHGRRHLVLAAAMVGLSSHTTLATTYTVTNFDDSGSGSLRDAINKANSAEQGNIQFQSGGGDITLLSPLPIITFQGSIDGADLTLNANNFRGLFVDLESEQPLETLAISNITITNGKAKGGNGGDGAFAGGGGLGAGGALFINSGAVTLNGFKTINSSAAGGNGGNAHSYGSGGGGGGLGGNGASAVDTGFGGRGGGGGGGGFYGNGGGGGNDGGQYTGGGGGGQYFAGGNGGLYAGGGGGGSAAVGGNAYVPTQFGVNKGGAGGAGGGGNGGDDLYGFDGSSAGQAGSDGGGGGGGGVDSNQGGTGGHGGRFGGGGGSAPNANAGDGGEFGGGGGSSNVVGIDAYTNAGSGGFGAGGGGGPGQGAGGFGGGSGAGQNGSPLAGAFAGSGAGSSSNHTGGGGGGAALGGAIFVRAANGASLTLNDPHIDAGSLTAGSGGATNSGVAFSGPGTAGQTAGSSLFLYGGNTTFFIDTPISITGTIADDAIGGNPGAITKTGASTLTLTANNTYAGGTTISAGTLQVGDGGAAGSIVGNVLDNGSIVFNRSDTYTFAGAISGSGSLGKQGTGTLVLTHANTYTGGTAINTGTLDVVDTTLPGGNIFLGGTTTLQYNTSTITVTQPGATFTGTGTIQKTGANNYLIFGGGGMVTVNLSAGALIDVQAGIFNTSSNYQANWTANKASLSIAAGAIVDAVEGGTSFSQQFDALNGAGLLRGGFSSNTGSLTTLTLGVANGSGTFTGVISDDPNAHLAITKAGTGAQILAGTNTYTGGTTISAGTLQLGNGGTTGSVAGNVTDNASLIFLRSDNPTFAGTISGTGSLTTYGTGTLILTGTNTYTGGTTIYAGTLQLGNGSATGSIAGNVTDDSALVFNRSGNPTFAGIISGTGSMATTGTGTLILTGPNTYTGLTTISAGTLQIGNGAAAGSVVGNILDNATLTFDRSDAYTYAGIVSGTGALRQIGAGSLILTAANSYSGGTTITAGTLQIGNNGTTGDISGNIADNATLIFSRSNTATVAGNITGTGVVTKNATGTLILTGTNNYSGLTTITAGLLQIGNGGTTGSITGNVLDNSSLAFSRSDSTTFPGNITGTGSLTKNGTGTLILTGANTLTGGTTISAGSLQIGNGAASGSLAGSITDNASVIFNRSDTFTVAGAISGSGSLLQQGAGTLVLTHANTYTGGTTIATGTLDVLGVALPGGNTSVAAGSTLQYDTSTATIIQPGATLTGTGMLQKNGTGLLAFGGAGTVNINLSAGSLIDIQAGTVNGSAAYQGNWIANQASLNIAAGAVFDTVEGGTSDSQQFNALSGAGALRGGFSGNPGGLTTLTLGVANSSGTFTGNISDDSSAHLAITKVGTGTQIFTGANTYTGGTTITAGILQIGNGGTTGSLAGNVTDKATLTFKRTDNFTMPGNITGPGNITQAGTGIVTLNNLRTTSATLSAGTLKIAANGSSAGLSTLTTLTIAGTFAAPTARLDLTDNDLILPTASISPANLRLLILAGYNNGAWTGNGIVASAALTTPGASLGYGTASSLGLTTLDGQTLAPSAVIVEFASAGDLNLDGKINADDFALMDRSFAKGGLPNAATWVDGDLDYSGTVTTADYLIIDRSFALQSGPLSPTFLAQRESQFGKAYVQQLITSIPEPTSLLLAPCGLAFLPRRRRTASHPSPATPQNL